MAKVSIGPVVGRFDACIFKEKLTTPAWEDVHFALELGSIARRCTSLVCPQFFPSLTDTKMLRHEKCWAILGAPLRLIAGSSIWTTAAGLIF